jgi:hypothetical protein
MTDLERLLTEALRETGESYEPSDQAEARRRFLERARRRRWYGFAQVAAVAGVGIAAFLFFTRPASEDKVEPKPEVAGAPEVVARVEVGGEPISIDAATGTEVWVTGGDRLVGIDPRTNEPGNVVLDTPADEVAVGEDGVWVARDGLTGYIDHVSLSSGDTTLTENVRALDGDGNFITWDIAIKGHSLLAVDGVTGNLYSFGDSARPDRIFRDFTWSDVAIDNGDVWVLDEDQGRVFRPSPTDAGDGSNFFTIEPGEDSDLAAGLGYVWVSSGDGTLRRLAPGGGAEMELPLGDSYMDLTVDEKAVWALVNIDERNKQLFEINPGTMEVIGEPLDIEGDANDVVAEAGSVWVADGRGEVLRIEPSRDADGAPLPAPEESPTPTEETAASINGQVVFVYSQGGDLYAETKNSGSVQLTDTPEIEEDPAMSPDGRYVLFERHGGSDENVVVELDLKRPGECCSRGGAAEPAVTAGGLQVAWVHPASDGKQAEIRIGGLSSEGFQGWPVSEFEEPMMVRNLVFDHTNQYLWYEAGYEGSSLFLAPLTETKNAEVIGIEAPAPVLPEGSDEGAAYKGVSGAIEANVVRVCCGSTHTGGFDEAEFGEIELGLDPRYTKLMDLGDLALDLDSQELFTSYLGRWRPLVTEDAVDWSESRNSTWLIGDATSLWVIEPATDEATELPMTADGGAAAPNDHAINPFAGAD